MTIRMSSVNHYHEQFQYEHWANSEVLLTLENHFTSIPEAGKLFAHILAAQQIWLTRLQNENWRHLAVWPAYDLGQVKKIHTRQLSLWEDYLKTLTGPGLSSVVSYHNSSGKLFETPIGKVLDHVLLHGAYHRGQIALLLRQGGFQPPATDYIVYTRRL